MAGVTPPLSVILERRNEIADSEERANTFLPPLPPTLEEFRINIDLPDGYQSRTLVVRPQPKSPLIDFLDSPRITSLRKSPKRPMLIYFHGGGFSTSSPLSLTLAGRLIAESLNTTVLLPSYRLAPEHSWQAPFQDAMSIVQMVASNPTYHYGADLEQGFMIGGISAGGSLAAVVAGLTTADSERYPLYYPLTGVFVTAALLFTDSIIPSEYRQFWTSREDNCDVEGFNTAYVDGFTAILGRSDYTSPWFSPINNPPETRLGHPPICLHACGKDPFRDDTVIYEKILAAAGVKTRLHIFSEVGHDALTAMMPVTPGSVRDPTMEEETLSGLKWLVAQTDS